ncbi:hypothetical protein YC2023_073229 [Brassica napus]
MGKGSKRKLKGFSRQEEGNLQRKEACGARRFCVHVRRNANATNHESPLGLFFSFDDVVGLWRTRGFTGYYCKSKLRNGLMGLYPGTSHLIHIEMIADIVATLVEMLSFDNTLGPMIDWRYMFDCNESYMAPKGIVDVESRSSRTLVIHGKSSPSPLIIKQIGESS